MHRMFVAQLTLYFPILILCYNQIGDLLKDWRRVNVAFTRARSKLVIFGSMQTLQNSPLLKEFFALMKEKDWILTLPPKAHELHRVPSETPLKCRPPKRSSQNTVLLKENELEVPRPQKKAKVMTESGILRSRPILRDLLNDTKSWTTVFFISEQWHPP